MKAVFKACLLSLFIAALAMPALGHAENIPSPLLTDPVFTSMNVLPGDDFKLMYFGETTATRDLITATADASNEVRQFLYGYPNLTTILIARDNSEFRLFIGKGDAPDQVKAMDWNVGYNGLVVIKSPAMLSDYKQVLLHHIARIAVRTMQTTYKSLPEWYQDGLASYVASDMTQDQRETAAQMAKAEAWMSLDDLEKAYKNVTIYNYDEQESRDARAQAAALVNYMGQLYGNRTLVGIIDNYAESGDLNRSFVNQTSFTPESMSAMVKNTLSGNNGSPAGQSGNGTIDGFLQNRDGTPAAGVTLSFTGHGAAINTTTDARGHYAANMAPGTYQIILPGGVVATGSPVVVDAGEQALQNVTIPEPQVVVTTTPSPQPGTSPSPGTSLSQSDLILYGFIAAVNAIGVIVVLAILRRNWH